MKVKEVYLFYQEFVKPIYAEIEARWNDIPVELLFETYATFDHIKRFYLEEENESIASSKALSHLKRGVLDAFKLKLKYFNIDTNIFLDSKVDFQFIDNGEFINSFYQDKHLIIQKAKEARLTESKEGKEHSFELWFETSILIDKFESNYFNNSFKVDWAKTKSFEWVNKDTIRGIIIGVISSVIVAIITSLFINN